MLKSVQIPMDPQTTPDRTRLVEDRLKQFRSLRLDRAEIRASRAFHVRHWLAVAEAAVCQDHRQLYYGGLSPSVESTVADYPDEQLPPAMQKTVLRDLAFMEGHLQALRDVLKALREDAADQG
jgi:hypothetical protein